MTIRSRLFGAWRSRSPRPDATSVVQILRAASVTTPVILAAGAERSLADGIAMAFPSARVLVDQAGEDIARSLRGAPGFDAIVDARAAGTALAMLRLIVWALAPRALYVNATGDPTFAGAIGSLSTAPANESPKAAKRRLELAQSIEIVPGPRGIDVVRKIQSHRFIVRHHEVESVLTQRDGDDWGEVLERRAAYQFTSRAHLTMHGEPAAGPKPEVIDVPELAVRRYRDVTCHGRNVVTRGDLILPETYRHWSNPRPFHKRIVDPTAQFGRALDDAPARRLDGEFFLLDSAFPTHFGHLTTETLSHVWGWEIARAANPDVRILMTHQTGKKALPTWKRSILAGLGIHAEDICWIPEHEPAGVESLITAMPQLENPHYVDRDLPATWSRLQQGLGPDPAPSERAEKIFISRGPKTQRYCTNTPEIEEFMRDQGFAVVFPEKLTVAEQAHTFAAAKVIAGFAGSGLFSMMFNPRAKVVILTSHNYVAANEYLFAAAAGNQIDYFWAPAQVDRPAKGHSVDAYQSDFEFPLTQHRSALIEALD